MAAPDPELLDDLRELQRCGTAVALLAVNRDITPVHVSKVTSDRQVRKVLSSIIRIYSDSMWSSYGSEGSASADGRLHREHIVPVRVLVDRLIMNPGESDEIFGSVVLADVTPEEHKRLGHIWKDHEDLYAEMLACEPSELLALGLRRYDRGGVRVDEYLF